jgi:hypothetical protein
MAPKAGEAAVDQFSKWKGAIHEQVRLDEQRCLGLYEARLTVESLKL